jgi:phage regulator Rha-like protein
MQIKANGGMKMYNFTLIKHNGNFYIDSREIAKPVVRTHNNLLRDIRRYIRSMEKSIDMKTDTREFFLESTYTSCIGRTMPRYLISKIGCAFLAQKLSWFRDESTLFTAAYVAAFSKAETPENDAEQQIAPLKIFNGAVRNILSGFSRAYATVDDVMGFLRGAYKPFGIKVDFNGGIHRFTATDIARRIGIYSETGRPHAHAVSSIIERLQITSEHIAIIPFGMVGVTMRYDEFVANAVQNWIDANNRPSEIPHLNFNYHIYYDQPFTLFDYDDDGFPIYNDE